MDEERGRGPLLKTPSWRSQSAFHQVGVQFERGERELTPTRAPS